MLGVILILISGTVECGYLRYIGYIGDIKKGYPIGYPLLIY